MFMHKNSTTPSASPAAAAAAAAASAGTAAGPARREKIGEERQRGRKAGSRRQPWIILGRFGNGVEGQEEEAVLWLNTVLSSFANFFFLIHCI